MSLQREPLRLTEAPANQDALADAIRAARGERASENQVAALFSQVQAAHALPSRAARADVQRPTHGLLLKTGLTITLVVAGSWLLTRTLDSAAPPNASRAASPTAGASPIAAGSPQPTRAQSHSDRAAQAPAGATPVPTARPPRVTAARHDAKHEPRAPTSLDPQAELALLRPAQALLLHEPAAALALTERHAREHPRGVFVEEREVLAMQAEIALGRGEQARRRARAFLANFPRSTHASFVRALLDGEDGHARERALQQSGTAADTQ